MITDSNSAASHTHTLMLSAPVKYPLVMRQYCLPHVVKRTSSARTANVHTAAIAQPLAIQISDVRSSLLQSRVGLNIPMRARYRAILRQAWPRHN